MGKHLRTPTRGISDS
jgi:phage terminase small subunit